MFSFGRRDAFNTGLTIDPTIGLVPQGRANIMLDQHWGWSFDVKKAFADATSRAIPIKSARSIVAACV